MNERTKTTPITVIIPNVATPKSTHVCDLSINALPASVRKARVLT